MGAVRKQALYTCESILCECECVCACLLETNSHQIHGNQPPDEDSIDGNDHFLHYHKFKRVCVCVYVCMHVCVKIIPVGRL